MNFLRCCLATLAILFAAGAKAVERLPVGRQTDDRLSDLVAALVATGRHDDALKICTGQRRGQQGASDAAAKWAIAQSQVLTQMQMGRDAFSSDDIERVERPITELIAAYPDHQRRLFLEAQQVAVAKSAALHHVLRVAVSPSSNDAREQATTTLLRAANRASALSDKIVQERSRRSRQPETGIAADYLRLEQGLRVDVVSMALMQTELFPAGSTDCIATATNAEQMADDAIERLPAHTPARHEVERLRVEAIVRSGQVDRAIVEASRLIRSMSKPLTAVIQALVVRLQIEKGNQAAARAGLEDFYTNDPESAPKSIEMDLARLEFLLRYESDSVGDWFESIGRRGGPYARRRAEAIAIGKLGAPDEPAANVSLIAAQGRDWLRRGDASRAGELLSAAAKAESDHDRALDHATEAAAAFVSAGRREAAATVLRDTALDHPSCTASDRAHLQAVVLAQSNGGENASANAIEAALRRHLEIWPGGSVARDVRRWLQQLLSAQGRHVEVAEVASSVPVDNLNAQDAEMIVQAWKRAFEFQALESTSDLSKRLVEVLGRTTATEPMRSRHRLIAGLLLDPEFLNELPIASDDDVSGPLASALIDFRKQGVLSDRLRDPPPQYVEDVVRRLMRDARGNPQKRGPIVQLVGQWQLGGESSFDRAERLIWNGDVQAASGMLRELISSSTDKAEAARRAAGLLMSTDSRGGPEEAIRIWDQLAAGSPQGSRLWHESKLASIDLLGRMGKTEEAVRRAKYVLLTNPKMSAELKRRYEFRN